MSGPRRSGAVFTISNGAKQEKKLNLGEYLKSVSYTDLASGGSDSLDLTLQNIDMTWLNSWYPKLGFMIYGAIILYDWVQEGKHLTIDCGTFTMDDMSFSGGPLEATLSAISAPASESFKTRERTATWKDVTVQAIASNIAKRHGLQLSYSGPYIAIREIEQSQKSDSSFLLDLCDKYGLAIKIYKSKIIIYDQTTLEKKKPVRTLKRANFIDDRWTYNDTIAGIYSGARIAYKTSKDSDEISIYLGMTPEGAGRVIKMNETATSESDAYYQAAAKVNKSNQGATTITGDIFPDPKIVAGATVKISGLGNADGKYFVDKSTIKITDSGTVQSLELHKCQKRLVYVPAPAPKPAPPSTPKPAPPPPKTYHVGDVVYFKGGTHYVSSWAGSTGYPASPGPAKINLGPDCAGNGGAHPWSLIHTDWQSNVYGWVDEGTFS